ncbi:MAG: polysaccharide deacetylase family protein [Xanthobacteraceae bacterium]
MANLRYAAYRAGLEALYFSGAHRALRSRFAGVGTILTLHHVRPARDGSFQPNRLLEIDPHFLERTIVHLRKRGIELVSIDEVWRRLVEQDFSRQFVAITFDDGYRDNLEHAWPVLRRHEVPFTLYIATNFPDRLGELWWIALEQVVAKSDRLVLEIDGTTRFFNCANAGAKRKVFSEVYWWLRSIEDEEEFRRAMRDICARYGVDLKAPCGKLCMDWAEIARLADDPLCTVGAHTVTHCFLTKVSDKVARSEMKRSAEVIEAALGKKPKHFSFPYGEAGAREFALAAEIGFKTAVTTRAGVLAPAHRHHLRALPRISLNGHFQALRYLDVLISGVPFALTGLGNGAEAT